MTKPAQNDKYLNDPTAWFQRAQGTLRASKMLFGLGDPLLFFPAALLGHDALEMFLKAALIRQGLKVDSSNGVWGHDLLELSKQFASIGKIQFPDHFFAVLKVFNDYFEELRYPQQLKNVEGLGQQEGEDLEEANRYLWPFAAMPKSEVAAIYAQATSETPKV
jgi:HEPN domain-containing protein